MLFGIGKSAYVCAEEPDFAVFRFTLGIPGFDDADIPRILGGLAIVLLVANHVFSEISTDASQASTRLLFSEKGGGGEGGGSPMKDRAPVFDGRRSVKQNIGEVQFGSKCMALPAILRMEHIISELFLIESC